MIKCVLAANGFFANGERVSEARLANGDLDGFFRRMEDMKWPVTLHCDLGCDNYDSVPWPQGRHNIWIFVGFDSTCQNFTTMEVQCSLGER